MNAIRSFMMNNVPSAFLYLTCGSTSRTSSILDIFFYSTAKISINIVLNVIGFWYAAAHLAYWAYNYAKLVTIFYDITHILLYFMLLSRVCMSFVFATFEKIIRSCLSCVRIEKLVYLYEQSNTAAKKLILSSYQESLSASNRTGEIAGNSILVTTSTAPTLAWCYNESIKMMQIIQTNMKMSII